MEKNWKPEPVTVGLYEDKGWPMFTFGYMDAEHAKATQRRITTTYNGCASIPKPERLEVVLHNLQVIVNTKNEKEFGIATRLQICTDVAGDALHAIGIDL